MTTLLTVNKVMVYKPKWRARRPPDTRRGRKTPESQKKTLNVNISHIKG